jgi:phage head maturation protease
LVGTLLTYGELAADRPERFEPGALRWKDGGVVLREMHDRRQPLVRFTPKVDGNLVTVDALMPDTARSRDAITLVRNGTYRGLSVEFLPERERMDGELRIIERAELVGAGLVDDPAYSGSRVSMRGRADGRVRFWL